METARMGMGMGAREDRGQDGRRTAGRGAAHGHDDTYERLTALKRKAASGGFMSKADELWLGSLIYESHPWTYPTEPGGGGYRDMSAYPPRTARQKRNAAMAKDVLYFSNRRLVFGLANRYHSAYHGHVPQDECEMNGFQGLARALDKYDYRKGCKFSTYAVWWIRRDIHRGTGRLARIVDIPEADMTRFTEACKDMEAGIARGDALRRNHLDEDTYRLIGDADAFYSSLETPIGGPGDDDDATLMDVIHGSSMGDDEEATNDPGDMLENETMMRDLALAIAALPDKQRRLMSILYGPDRKVNGKYRPVSDTRAREELGVGKREYDALKSDAMGALTKSMTHWRNA